MSEIYLTERSLGELLSEHYTDVLPQKTPPGTTLRVDYVSGSQRAVWEFDGYHHYTRSSTQSRDEKLRYWCLTNNCRLFQIPYWIQPSSDLHRLFGFRPAGINAYPHGFVSRSNTCVTPDDFNYRGTQRFIRELATIKKISPRSFRQVMSSVSERCDQSFSVYLSRKIEGV
jgi:hypothetical protein